MGSTSEWREQQQQQQISDFEDTTVEISQSEQQRENRLKK